jgi:DHA1 family bicyclomycin/chloramphenicol resistance-like MFS transporter
MPVRSDSFGMTVLLAGMTSMTALALDTYVPSLPQMSQELGVSAATGQLTLTAFMIGNAAGMVAFGPLSDAFGRRRLTLMGIAVCVAASALCAVSTSIGLLLVGRFLQAVGAAASQVTARAVVRDLYSGHRAARELALITMLTATVPTAAPILGATLQEFFNWRASFFVVMGYSVVLMGTLWIGLAETRPADSAGAAAPLDILRAYRPLLRDRTVLIPVLCGVSFGGVFSWMSIGSYLLQEVYGASPIGFAVASAVCVSGLIAGSYLTSPVAVRIGARATTFLGTAIMVAGGILMLAVFLAGVAGIVTTVLGQCVFLFGMAVARPHWQGSYLQLHARRAGTASSMLGVAQMTIATALVTVVIQMLGAGAATMAGYLFVTALVCLFLQVKVRHMV